MYARRWLTIGCLLLAPMPVFAQAVLPEALLPQNCVLYFRYDGVEPHRKAYDQTAWAESMRGELGNLVDYAVTVVKEAVNHQLKEIPPGGKIPDTLMKIQNASAYVPALLDYFGKNGLALGIEVIDLQKPRGQVTVVFPNGGAARNREALFAVFQLIASLAEVKVKESKSGNRTIYEMEGTDPVRVAWWQEGEHVVYTAGTEGPDHVLALVGGDGKPNLTANPIYKNMMEFKAYETMGRGFLDFGTAISMAKRFFPPAEKISKDLGLDGLKSLVAHVGFEGKAQRSTVIVNLQGERKGLLRLAVTPKEPFDLAKLPPIPPDSSSFSMFHLDLATLYDVGMETAEIIMQLVAPNELPQLQQAVQAANQMVGFDIRKDLLSSLDSMIVSYNSPSEGPFTLGNAYLIKVKDAKKIQSALTKLLKVASDMGGVQISIKSRNYQGTELNMVNVAQEGFFFVPSFAFHNDWMVIGFFPQTVQGYLLRANGKMSSWKPTPLLEKALADARQNPNAKITGLSVSDPRPTLKQLLSLAPIAAAVGNSFAPGIFDPSMVPNAQAVTEPLFPNVAVTIDEGTAIRSEGYESFALPIDFAGMDMYIAASALMSFWSLRSMRGF